MLYARCNWVVKWPELPAVSRRQCAVFLPQCLPYSLLLQQLELKNVRELEDLLIEAVYCDIIQGKLDQRNQQVEVDCSVGRDLGHNELPNIANTLQEW